MYEVSMSIQTRITVSSVYVDAIFVHLVQLYKDVDEVGIFFVYGIVRRASVFWDEDCYWKIQADSSALRWRVLCSSLVLQIGT